MSASAAHPSRVARRSIDAVAIAGVIAAIVCATPAIAVIGFALAPSAGEPALLGNLATDGAFGTIALALVGGGVAIVVGALAAWLVSLAQFPGRGVFSWLLVLPLAAPSYVLAYSYSALTWAGGSINFPVRGFWGAAFIYAVGLYPYVYLAARGAFASQSADAFDAARALGARPHQVFWRVALPLARPGIVAGGALVLMEIAADYGGAAHFGLTTMSTAIFRAWYAHGAPHAALQLSAMLLVAALAFLIIERRARGRQAFAGGSTRWRPLTRTPLNPLHAALAIALCAALVLLGAIIPLGYLVRLGLFRSAEQWAELSEPLFNTIFLASLGAAVTLVLSLIIAAASRRGGAGGKAALLASGVGYAAPGAVVALGALSLFGVAREYGWVGGLGGALAFGMLIWVYAARFASAGAQPIEAGLTRLSKGIDASARVLGASALKRLLRVDLPIAAPSAAAAALIVFVEILKELPATLILRPFNFDTLAVKANAYASDERLIQASAPSLLIFLAGLAPILLLSRSIERSRAGTR